MVRNIKHVLALGVVLAAAVPAFAGGKGGSSHSGSQHASGYVHGYYNHGHYYEYRGYRYWGGWPFGYYWYDPTALVTPGVVDNPFVPATFEGDEPPPPPPVPASPSAANAAVVRIRTAAGAKMWFDGSATTQTGEVRTFTTPPLNDGRSYSYGIRACWLEDGRPVVRSRTVSVVAGRTIDVDLR
jgi:uncharacterized protein (TIGR03000 family)